MTKYTIDRMEDGYYVLLDREDEEQEWLLPVTAVIGDVEEGDIVSVTVCETEENRTYELTRHEEERKAQEDYIRQLLEKLQKKNKKDV